MPFHRKIASCLLPLQQRRRHTALRLHRPGCRAGPAQIASENEHREHGLALILRGHDKDRTYNMGYSELLAPLVKAVQQQQQETAAEADDNASLKQLIAAQQKEIELTKLQIRILAQPHPAQIDLPTSLPARPAPEGDKQAAPAKPGPAPKGTSRPRRKTRCTRDSRFSLRQPGHDFALGLR